MAIQVNEQMMHFIKEATNGIEGADLDKVIEVTAAIAHKGLYEVAQLGATTADVTAGLAAHIGSIEFMEFLMNSGIQAPSQKALREFLNEFPEWGELPAEETEKKAETTIWGVLKGN